MELNPTEVCPNVTLRDGSPVMIFAYFEKQQRSYVGAFYHKDAWIACSWNKNGTYIHEKSPTPIDLIIIKVPPKQLEKR